MNFQVDKMTKLGRSLNKTSLRQSAMTVQGELVKTRELSQFHLSLMLLGIYHVARTEAEIADYMA